eukprot:COSAG01_NODE_128_length_24936_cov_324.347264_2_plen_421_part_00
METNYSQKITLICTGQELLDGRVCNSNAVDIGEVLDEAGFALSSVLVLSDDWDDLIEGIQASLACSDVLLITGGLGPTEDDRTVAALAHVLGVALKQHDQACIDMKAYFKSRGRQMSDNNLKQALLPEGASYIKNNLGSAPAFTVLHEGVLIACLQGVPSEMLPLFKGPVLTQLHDFYLQKGQSILPAKRWLFRCTALGESDLAARVDSLGPLPHGLKLSYRASFPEIQLRFQLDPVVDQSLVLPYIQAVDALLAGYCFAKDRGSLAALLLQLCQAKQLRLAVAESCTGGLLSALLTAEAGASAVFIDGVVTYSNAAKQQRLAVPATLIAQEGAVSEAVAKAMLQGLLSGSGADYGMAITGIAGPDGGSEGKPVGTVYIAYGALQDMRCKLYAFRGQRADIQRRAAFSAVLALYQLILLA